MLSSDLSLFSYLHGCENPIVHGNLSCDTIFIQHNGLIKIGSGQFVTFKRDLKIPGDISHSAYPTSNLTMNLNNHNHSYEMLISQQEPDITCTTYPFSCSLTKGACYKPEWPGLTGHFELQGCALSKIEGSLNLDNQRCPAFYLFEKCKIF